MPSNVMLMRLLKLRAREASFIFCESIPSPVAIFLLLKNEKQLMSPNVPLLLLILAPWVGAIFNQIYSVLYKVGPLYSSDRGRQNV